MYEPTPGLRGDLGEWRALHFNGRLRSFEAQLPGYIAKWDELDARLKATGHGTELVVDMALDPRIDLLLERGALGTGDVVRETMELKQCHANSILLANERGLLIGTGYGSAGQDWRSHSWVVDPDNGLIIETTPYLCVAYWGIVGTAAELYPIIP